MIVCISTHQEQVMKQVLLTNLYKLLVLNYLCHSQVLKHGSKDQFQFARPLTCCILFTQREYVHRGTVESYSDKYIPLKFVMDQTASLSWMLSTTPLMVQTFFYFPLNCA